MIKHIPAVLIYARLLIGFAIISISIANIAHYPLWATMLLTIGLLTDIFDGIIARKLNISTTKLRRLDSTIDQVFFISVAVATYLRYPDFFADNVVKLIILFSFEAATYLISFFKFKREIATHTIGAKIWTLFLFATLVEITWRGDSVILFNLCFWIGLITRLEIMGIILVLKQWTNDVPTIYHSFLLRNNKEIKRNKLFNG